MQYLTCGVSSLLHFVNLILFTLFLVHHILRISPPLCHHLRSHHLSLPRPFTPDLKLISFTNPFLHSHSFSFQTDAFTDLNLYWIRGALLCLFHFLATCARLSWILSFRVQVKFPYRIVSFSPARSRAPARSLTRCVNTSIGLQCIDSIQIQKFIQGHRSWCQSKAYMQLPISH